MSNDITQCRSPHDHVEDHTAAELRESAYRRGYHQALYEIMDAAREGIPVTVHLERWEDSIMRWRYRLGRHKRARSTVEPPPRPPWERKRSNTQ